MMIYIWRLCLLFVVSPISFEKKTLSKDVASIRGLKRINDNVLALGAVADFGAQNFRLTTKVDAR
jgi:hypothetical protein